MSASKIPQTEIEKAYAALEQLKKTLDITPDLRFRMKHRLLKMPDIEQVHEHYRSFGQQMDKLVEMKTKITRLSNTAGLGRTLINQRIATSKMITDSIHQMYGSSAHIVHKFIVNAHYTLLKNAHFHLEIVNQIFVSENPIPILEKDPFSFDYRCEETVLEFCDDGIPLMLKELPFIIMPSNFIETYKGLNRALGKSEKYFHQPGLFADINTLQHGNVLDAEKFKIIKDQQQKEFLVKCCKLLDITEQPIGENINTKGTICFIERDIKDLPKPITPSMLLKIFKSNTMQTHICATINRPYQDAAKDIDKWNCQIVGKHPERHIEFKNLKLSMTVNQNDNKNDWINLHIAFKEFLKSTYIYLDLIINKLIHNRSDKTLFITNVNEGYDYKSNKELTSYLTKTLGIHETGKDTIAYFQKKAKEEERKQPSKGTLPKR